MDYSLSQRVCRRQVCLWVLILILMDYSLSAVAILLLAAAVRVLILILMDYSLSQYKRDV